MHFFYIYYWKLLEIKFGDVTWGESPALHPVFLDPPPPWPWKWLLEMNEWDRVVCSYSLGRNPSIFDSKATHFGEKKSSSWVFWRVKISQLLNEVLSGTTESCSSEIFWRSQKGLPKCGLCFIHFHLYLHSLMWWSWRWKIMTLSPKLSFFGLVGMQPKDSRLKSWTRERQGFMRFREESL